MLGLITRIIFIAGLASSVAAHAYVQEVVLGGADHFSGWLPFSDPYEAPLPSRIVRKVPNDSPILDPFSADLACNIGGEEPAGTTGDIQAGQSVQFIWSRWPTDHKGPVTVWMASCGGSCSSFKSSSAKWFAIDKKGMNADGTYATDDLIAAGASWTVNVPSNVAPGEYLIRIELLALHSTGAPQFYPSCSQIRVSGSGTGAPADGEAVSIQEIYQGYQFPNIWQPISVFEIAGPAVASFVSGSTPAPAPVTSAPAPATSSAAPVQSTSSPSVDSGVSVPINVANPLPTTSTKLCKGKLVRRKKAKRNAAPIDAPSFAHHKRNMARRHHDFSY